MKRILLPLFILLLAPLSAVAVTYIPGGSNGSPTGGNPQGPGGVTGLPTPVVQISEIQTLVYTAISWMFWMLIILAIMFIIVSAYGYVTSGGDPDRVHGANRMLIFASVAVVVAIFAGSIPLLIGSLFQVYGIGACGAFGRLFGF